MFFSLIIDAFVLSFCHILAPTIPHHTHRIFKYVTYVRLRLRLQTTWTFGLLQFKQCSSGYFESAFHMIAMFLVRSRPAYSSPSRPDLMHMWAWSVPSSFHIGDLLWSSLRLSFALLYGWYLSALPLSLLSFSSDTQPLTAFPSHYHSLFFPVLQIMALFF